MQLATARGTTNRGVPTMYQRDFRSEIAGGTFKVRLTACTPLVLEYRT